MFRRKWTIEVKYENKRPVIMESFEFRTKRAARRITKAVQLLYDEEGRTAWLRPVKIEKEK